MPAIASSSSTVTESTQVSARLYRQLVSQRFIQISTPKSRMRMGTSCGGGEAARRRCDVHEMARAAPERRSSPTPGLCLRQYCCYVAKALTGRIAEGAVT